MKILVEGIPAAGREVSFGPRDEWAAEAAAVALDAPAARLSGTISIQRASAKGVLVVGVASEAAASATCDRCGEPADRVALVEARLLYAPEERGSAAYDGGELELEADDLDLGWYSEGEIDLGDVLREALALALPSRTTCANAQECDKRTDELLAATRASSAPFAALRGWKPGTGGG